MRFYPQTAWGGVSFVVQDLRAGDGSGTLRGLWQRNGGGCSRPYGFLLHVPDSCHRARGCGESDVSALWRRSRLLILKRVFGRVAAVILSTENRSQSRLRNSRPQMFLTCGTTLRAMRKRIHIRFSMHRWNGLCRQMRCASRCLRKRHSVLFGRQRQSLPRSRSSCHFQVARIRRLRRISLCVRLRIRVSCIFLEIRRWNSR